MIPTMSPSSRRRYQLRRNDLNERIENLLDAAQREGTDPQDTELARQLIVTGVRLLRDRTSRAELKLVNSALKELRHAFRVFKPYIEAIRQRDNDPEIWIEFENVAREWKERSSQEEEKRRFQLESLHRQRGIQPHS